MKRISRSIYEFKNQPTLLFTAFRLLITDAKFLRTFRPLLNPATWSEPELEWVVDAITTHSDENSGAAPAFKILRMRLEQDPKMPEHLGTIIKQFMAKTKEHTATVDEVEFVTAHFEEFLRYRITLYAIRRSQNFVEQGDFEAAVKVVSDSQAIRLVDDEDWYTLPNDLKLYYDLFSKEVIEERAIPTGLEALDIKLAGGARPKELGIWMAGTGGGKSMALVMCGAEAFRQGKTVVHFTFENSREETLARYAHNMLAIDSDLLYNTDPDINGFNERLSGLLGLPGEGKVLIKEMVGSLTDKAVLSAVLNKLQGDEGSQIDMVIVDYGDYMQPLQKSDQRHERLQSVFEELRELAREYNAVVWTASQTNRLGMQKNKALVEYIGASLGKAQVADVIIAISRENANSDGNEDGEEEDQSRRLHLVKVRRSTGDNWYMRCLAHFAQARFIAIDP